MLNEKFKHIHWNKSEFSMNCAILNKATWEEITIEWRKEAIWGNYNALKKYAKYFFQCWWLRPSHILAGLHIGFWSYILAKPENRNVKRPGWKDGNAAKIFVLQYNCLSYLTYMLPNNRQLLTGLSALVLPLLFFCNFCPSLSPKTARVPIAILWIL